MWNSSALNNASARGWRGGRAPKHRLIKCCLAWLCWLGLAAPAYASGGDSSGPMMQHMMGENTPLGLWVTANHNAVIKISSCGGDLCGQITGMALKPSDPIPMDWQGASQCGLIILKTAPEMGGDGSMAWTGTVLDPRDGSVYHARIWLDNSHHLLLRGYLGLPVFGQTQTWSTYTGAIANCRLASSS